METFIQTLINSYRNPALLTSEPDSTVLYANSEARRLLKSDLGEPVPLEKLFSKRGVILKDELWERDDSYFRIQSEKLTLGDTLYSKFVLTPITRSEFQDFHELQQEMSRMLVHRLHSPLNGLTGFTELLLEQPLSQKQMQYVKAIEGGLTEFKEILAEIHTLAQEVAVHYSGVRVSDLARAVVEEFDSGSRKRITVEQSGEDRVISTDFVLMKSILHELLENALEHGPEDGEVTLSFSRERVIQVTNRGSAIPERYVNKMFLPFFSNKARGLGLGLPKSLLFAREMGYRIVLAENSPARGITFEVRMEEGEPVEGEVRRPV